MADRPDDSGDPNRARDKSKDVHVFIKENGCPAATVYLGLDQPKVVWAVYGPQDAADAIEICEGVLAALKGQTPRVTSSAPSVAGGQDAAPPVAKKSRPMSAAFREHIAAGLSDDDIWAKIVAEFNCSKEHRTRIKEYRREAESKGTPPTHSAQDPYLEGIAARPDGKHLLDMG